MWLCQIDICVPASLCGWGWEEGLVGQWGVQGCASGLGWLGGRVGAGLCEGGACKCANHFDVPEENCNASVFIAARAVKQMVVIFPLLSQVLSQI